MIRNFKLFGKRFSTLIVIFTFAALSSLNAQNVQFHLVSSDRNEAVIRVDFPTFQTQTVNANGQAMSRLDMAGAYPMEKMGAPELLQTATSLIVPENSVVSTEIVNSEYMIFENFELAPSKGRLLRNVNPDEIAYLKGAEYEQDQFLFNDTVEVGSEYQLRDFHGVPVRFFPFAYNPVRKALKAYSSIIVRVRFESNQTVKSLRKVSKTFNDIYSDHFLNYASLRSQPLEEVGRILILAPENFCAAMQPYANWKIRNGYPTEIVPLSTAGSSSAAIKNYIASYYNEHSDFTFLVMVGDNNQFPTISVGGNVSDNYYGEIVGNDVYPDIIIGKISAETVEQVAVQVQKFIQYERNPVETSHLPIFLGIASNQGPGDNNEYDYDHIRNIGTKLSNYTYTSGHELFEGSQGGVDAAGDPSSSAVAAVVNSGVGIINYCGHGAETYWVTSGFGNSDIANLTNYDKLPFIFSVACVNGDYSGRTCFAEAWLRATKNGQPTGAVGALMSTINQPWNSPMCAQDHMNDILTGISAVPQKYTYGGIIFNGIIKMLDQYNDYEVSRTWILFGDPALLVRTAVPETLPLSYAQNIPVGSSNVTFSSPVDGAKVSLSRNNEVLSSGIIVNGTVTLDIPNTLIPMDTISILATASNYIPFVGSAQIIPVDGPFVFCNAFSFSDNADHDGLVDYGETINVTGVLENVGNTGASAVTVSVSTDDQYVHITSVSPQLVSSLASHTTEMASIFSFTVDNVVPANHIAVFSIQITHDGESHPQQLSIPLHAPQLKVANVLTVDDQVLGNGNRRLDFNESAYLHIQLGNDGNCEAKPGVAHVTSEDGKIHLYRIPYNTVTIQEGEVWDLVVRVSVDESVDAPTTSIIHVNYSVDDYQVSQDIPVKIGMAVEDWESGSFSQFEWVNISATPWTITTEDPYEGTYAARSGAIGNSASSILRITQTNAQPDSISFYFKVSSEESYDFLKFFIDNSLVGNWSGQHGWTRAAYAVPAGEHTFKWVYEKDYMMDAGSDMAMLDYISLPINGSNVSVETYALQSVVVAPNPASDVVSVMISDENELDGCECQLYDLSGRLLQIVPVTGTTTTMNVSGYAKGLYLLKIQKEGRLVKTVKIVKQ